MNWSNYSDLKSAGKVEFAKQKETVREAVAEVRNEDDEVTTPARAKEEREFVSYVEKRWDSATGEAQADGKREWNLSDLEREKSRYDSDIARAKAQSDELAKAIADFKKL
jgi:hypothetical protein